MKYTQKKGGLTVKMGVKINVSKLCVKMVAFLGVFGRLNVDRF